MATQEQEQRQKVTMLWTESKEFVHNLRSEEFDNEVVDGVSEEKVRMAVGRFLGLMELPSDASKVSTLTNAVMGVAPNDVEEEIKCLLGLLYGSGSGSGSGSSSALSDDPNADGCSKVWCRLFNAPFDDPDGRIVQYFRAKLDHCVSQFYDTPSRWYAPYVAIVQASGWGKSRAIKQMASEGLLVFYFSLMPKESMGYPRADQQIRERLLSVTTVEDAYAIFRACLLWLFEQDEWPNTANFFEQQQTLRWPPELKKRILNIEACTSVVMQQAFTDVWDKFKPREGASILFVVDDARQLLQLQAQPKYEEARDTPFTLLRRACREFMWKAETASGALLVAVDSLALP